MLTDVSLDMKSTLIFFLLLFVQTFSAAAQPEGIHLSWNGNTSSSMAITWVNAVSGKEGVMYGKDSLHLDKTAPGLKTHVAEQSFYVNKAVLQKLNSDTYYYYKVGSNETGWSMIYRFRTSPRAGTGNKIVVGVWSDTQNNTGNLKFERTDSIVKQLRKEEYSFTIHNGDLVENGSVVKSWSDLFNVTQPVNARSPLMSVTGNHDVNNDSTSSGFQKPFPVFYEVMNLPGNQLNYSFDYGNAHFIAINSGWAEGAAKVGKVLFERNSEEYKWLEKDLKKARKNKRIRWIILYSHYPVYSYGFSHIPAWQSHLKPLVDKYKVDIYLAGHRHVYERHKAIRGSDVFEMTDVHAYNKPEGTVYITNGSCGGNLTGPGGYNLPTMVFTPKEKIFTYSLMTIEGDRLFYEAFNMQGERIDYFTINKK
jgi:predicted phosphodiesterase